MLVAILLIYSLIKRILQQLSSTRSSISQRVCALQAIEQLLATICNPRASPNTFNAFILVQDSFESNGSLVVDSPCNVELIRTLVASRLVTILASWLSILQDSLENVKVSGTYMPKVWHVLTMSHRTTADFTANHASTFHPSRCRSSARA